MSKTLLLLHLVGGYLFLKYYLRTHFYFYRLQGYHLIFTAILPATGLFGISFFIVSLFRTGNLWFEYFGSGVLSMVLGFGVAKILNRFISDNKLLELANKSVRQRQNPLELLLLTSINETKKICITLQNNKVYVGQISRLYDPKSPLQYINILPIYSGYRDQATKEMKLTLNYEDVYRKMIEKETPFSLADFQIVIRASDIVTANVFDSTVYKEHFKN